MPPQSPPPVPPPASGGDASLTDTSGGSIQTLKQNYLSLLPQEQIIQICLALDLHAPQHVQTTVWPVDLQAAIQTLKSGTAPSTPGPLVAADVHSLLDQPTKDAPTEQVHPPGPPVSTSGVPPMASLLDDAAPPSRSSQPSPSSAETAAPKPSQDSEPSTHGPSIAGPSTPAYPRSAANSPAPQPPSVPQPHAPYPYAPYGYVPKTPQQPAYPHTPYYATSPPVPPGYPPHYPYAGYPPPPGYPSTSTGHPAYPPAGSPPPGAMTESPANAAYPMPPAEDLPSYEEMIVEALMDTSDPEGAAPKDLFAWMASRYPLQTNFRPSASQALQKAYKRGRLEKRHGGKYRINPSWEGGTTSKRTTRKPQTLAQTTYAMQQGPPASPFTNAPLHHRSNHTPYPQSGPPGHYSGYPYNYPPSGYPSYHTPGLSQYYQQQPGHQPTTANKTPAQSSAPAPAASAAPSASSTAPAVAGSSKDGADKAHTADGHDANAWEAAQHILQAINFTLHQIEDPEQPETPAVTASNAPATAPAAPSTSAPTQTAAEAPRTTLTEDERASLQAQLALLAAQLTEIANESDDEDEDMQEPIQVPSQLQPAHELPALEGAQAQPESIPQAVPPVQSEASAAPDSNQFGDLSSEAAGRAMAMLLDNLDSAAQALAAEEGEESDEDEDMEMVEVPTYVESDALRT